MALKWNKQLTIDYQRTFNTPEGKRVLADLKKKCLLVTSSINIENGVDEKKALVLLGEHRVLMHIYKMLHRDPNEEAPPRAVNRNKGE